MKHIRKSFLTLAAAASLLFGASIAVTPATAAPVPVLFNFTGDITTSQFPLTPTILTSYTISGTFTVDTNSATPAAPPGSGIYPAAVLTYSMNFLNASNVVVYSASQSGLNGVSIIDNSALGSGAFGDRWLLQTNATGGAISGFSPNQFEIRLDGDAGGVSSLLSSNALQAPPSIDSNPNLTTKRWSLLFKDEDGLPRVVTGTLTSLTAVPLPPAVLLFGAGIVALIGLGARNWRLKGSSIA